MFKSRCSGEQARAAPSRVPLLRQLPHSTQAASTMSSSHFGANERDLIHAFLAAGLAMAALLVAVPALSQTINTVAGGGDGGAATSASLADPVGVALDASGNLYIADANDLRKVAAGTGNSTTAAGDGGGGT